MPAYTIGKQKRNTHGNNNPNPGVGFYSPNVSSNTIINKPPNIVMGTSPKSKKEYSNSPGPGKYNITPFTASSQQKGVSMKPRLKQISRFQTPSPNQYDTNKSVSSKKYSFSKNFKTPQKEKTPDPQSYSYKYSNVSSPVSIFGTAKRDLTKLNKVPGPGKYDVRTESSKSKSPSVTFQRNSRFKQQSPQNVKPGPFEYSPYKEKLHQKAQNGKFGQAKREHKISANKQKSTPGVGSYNTKDSLINQQSPRVVLGTSPRKIHQSNLNPGPGKYNTISTSLGSQTAEKTIFGTSSRFTICHYENPGPGFYQTNLCQNSKKNQGYTISPRNLRTQQQRSPGPQKYSPTAKQVLNNSARVKFGNAKKFLEYKNQVPGPGKYIHNYNLNKQSFSFSRSTDKKQMYANVGPGSYTIKPIIGMYDGCEKDFNRNNQPILYV